MPVPEMEKGVLPKAVRDWGLKYTSDEARNASFPPSRRSDTRKPRKRRRYRLRSLKGQKAIENKKLMAVDAVRCKPVFTQVRSSQGIYREELADFESIRSMNDVNRSAISMAYVVRSRIE